jgi:hypothetical protein
VKPLGFQGLSSLGSDEAEETKPFLSFAGSRDQRSVYREKAIGLQHLHK